MTGVEVAALIEAAVAIVTKLVGAALDGAQSAQEAIEKMDAIDAQLDAALANLKASLAANDAEVDAAARAKS
jgi:hypothetical protein